MSDVTMLTSIGSVMSLDAFVYLSFCLLVYVHDNSKNNKQICLTFYVSRA